MKKNSLKKVSMLLATVCMCSSIQIPVYASESESVIDTVVLENSDVGIEELVIDNIPEQVTDELNIDKKNIIEVSDRDAEDLSSITVVNNDATETAYMFSEPAKIYR